jgi:type 1 glutamine amidotransferase
MPVVLAADTGKATIPISSLGTGEKGLMVNTTKAQIDAAIAAAAKGKPAT